MGGALVATPLCFRREIMCKNIFILFMLFNLHAIAQQSNSSFYPLKVGNRWEYRVLSYEAEPIPDTSYYSKEIIGDTLLPNGINYFIVKERNHIHFERFDTLSNEIKYYERMCDSLDGSIYSLNYVVDSVVVWYQCGEYPHNVKYEDPKNSRNSAYIILECGGLIYSDVTFQNHLGLKKRISREVGMWVTDLIGAVIDGETWGVVTSVTDPNGIPKDYDLMQNYPNPFNPKTLISYSTIRAGHVELAVYNITGENVSILVDQYQEPGEYKISFDASGLPSGIYFYRIITDEFIETKKMILLR